MTDRRDQTGGASATTTVYTIGHSTRSLEDFIALLRREGVRHVADVRAFPASRRYPHFNREPLAAELEAKGIGYSHHPALGGRRTPRPDSLNAGWRNAGFRGYADHMATPEFERALKELVTVGGRARTAVMCSEAVPWRCHRTLIADALVARGIDVRHILDSATSAHAPTRFAVIEVGRVSYPAEPQGANDQEELFD
jgi:uncharacterized protein (DUF488 family)